MQANKRQKFLESQAARTSDDDNASTSGDSSDEEQEHMPSAATSLITDLGAAPASNDKYRDENFYLGYDRGDNKYAEEGFAVGGQGQDMVLDMAGDENVSGNLHKREMCPMLYLHDMGIEFQKQQQFVFVLSYDQHADDLLVTSSRTPSTTMPCGALHRKAWGKPICFAILAVPYMAFSQPNADNC